MGPFGACCSVLYCRHALRWYAAMLEPVVMVIWAGSDEQWFVDDVGYGNPITIHTFTHQMPPMAQPSPTCQASLFTLPSTPELPLNYRNRDEPFGVLHACDSWVCVSGIHEASLFSGSRACQDQGPRARRAPCFPGTGGGETSLPAGCHKGPCCHTGACSNPYQCVSTLTSRLYPSQQLAVDSR